MYTTMSLFPSGIAHMNREPTIASVTAQRDWDATEGQLARRKRRYQTESDPLYLEWQYDKTPEAEQVWRDKVSEIKAQLPIGVNPLE